MVAGRTRPDSLDLSLVSTSEKESMYRDRIRLPSLMSKVMSAADAAALIEDGMTVGMSGFTRAGEAKAVPQALTLIHK